LLCILEDCLCVLEVRVGFSLWLFAWGPGCGVRLLWLCLLYLLVGNCLFIRACWWGPVCSFEYAPLTKTDPDTSNKQTQKETKRDNNTKESMRAKATL